MRAHESSHGEALRGDAASTKRHARVAQPLVLAAGCLWPRNSRGMDTPEERLHRCLRWHSQLWSVRQCSMLGRSSAWEVEVAAVSGCVGCVAEGHTSNKKHGATRAWMQNLAGCRAQTAEHIVYSVKPGIVLNGSRMHTAFFPTSNDCGWGRHGVFYSLVACTDSGGTWTQTHESQCVAWKINTLGSLIADELDARTGLLALTSALACNGL
eukprot:jgi/Ulvmu1/11180/UM072_0016.1